MPPLGGGARRNYNNNNNNNNGPVGGGGPPKVLNVAEKPSVARALASVFHRIPGARDGGMRREAAQIFTHDSVPFPNIYQQGAGTASTANNNRPHTMITTSVRGHLSNMDFPAEYGWSRCDPLVLFDAPLEVVYNDNNRPLQEMLIRLSRQVDAVILWLDCDREGEAIGEEVQQVVLEGNGRLQSKIYRAKFSTVLDGEIRRALQTLGRLNNHFVQAVQARMQLDLRVGAAFTRFQTLRLQKKFQYQNGGGSSVVSYGPCQFPTLGFVVERWARIETFVPEDFWFIELTLKIPNEATSSTENGNANESNDATGSNNNANNRNQRNHNNNSSRPIFFTWKRHRLYDQILTAALYESCLDAQQATVTSLTGRPKNKWRPVPLATVELQKRASRYLRIGSETLMTAAEELYQQGYISYPRTETEKFRPEFQHYPLIQQFESLGVAPYSGYANKLLHQNGFQTPRAGQHDDQAHPPITPAKVVDPNSIQDPTQRGVYTLVVKHYLACCSRDAIGKETQLQVQMASEEFTAKGLMITQKNWLEIYEPWERWSTGQGELPNVQVGSRITPHSLLMKDGRTTPPSPISEVELISLMDRNGIGTDATIAQHITTIQERSYSIKNASQQFLPTPLGIALIEGYNSMGYQLNKPDLRREMEHECNLVANGHKTLEDIVGPILQKMKQVYQRATAEATKLDQAMARHFPRLGVVTGGNNRNDNNNNQFRVLQANFSECGVCHNQMTLKQEQQTANNNTNNRTPRKLLFCNTCQMGWTLPRGTLTGKTNDTGSPVHCAICNYQVIQVSQGDGYQGNGYHVCPKCFTDVPVEHAGGGNGDFRCFQCTHPTCTLATGGGSGSQQEQEGTEAFACPFCTSQRGGTTSTPGKIFVRKNSRGYVLSCSNYRGAQRCSYTIWLPRATSTVTALPETTCRACSTGTNVVRKVHFVWKSGDTPPHIGRESTVCILCDVAFRQDLQINLPTQGQVLTTNRRVTNQPRQAGGGAATTTTSYRRNANTATSSTNPTGRFRRGGASNNNSNYGNNNRNNYNNRSNNNNNNSRGRNNNTFSNGGFGGGGGGPGGGVCYRCNQPGHYANACPMRNQ